MPTHAKTHEECRLAVCLLCMGKTKDMRQLNEKHRKVIEEFLITGYDEMDSRLPLSICGNCRTVVQQYSKGNFTRTIDVFDHSEIDFERPVTRSLTKCECKVCQVATASTTLNFSKTLIPLRKKPGRCASSSTTTPISSTECDSASKFHSFKPEDKPKPIKVCSYCLTILNRGKEHKCTKGTRNVNVKELACQGSPKSKEKVASAIIKDKVAESAVCNEISLATSTGLPIPLIVFPTSNKSRASEALSSCSKKNMLLTSNDVSKMQVDMNLSNNQTLRLASHIRTATGNRHIIECNLKEKLLTINHKLDDYFDAIRVDYVTKEGVGPNSTILQTPKATVYCTDVGRLISHILEERQYHSEETVIKIGVDGGGGFMKVCLSVQYINDEAESNKRRRLSYSEGVAAKNLKDTSVKRLFIIGIAPNVQENHLNVLKIWILLKLTDKTLPYPIQIATDLKLANILLGLSAHGSAHPCSWCNIDKEHLVDKGVLRTIGSISDQFWAWHEAGSDLKKAKNFYNCIHLPILKGNPETKVINLIPPPELHLFLGPVNTMFNSMLKEWPDAILWPRACNVERESMHGGSFNGNSCRLLLSKLHVLETLCPLQCLSYIAAFQDFKKVVNACYGTTLQSSYKLSIDNFKKSYLNLGINVTPKLHAVFHHISDFCDPRQSGLGRWSEQASEAVHSDFKSTWLKYKVPEEHPDYSSKLLCAVRDYNCKHV